MCAHTCTHTTHPSHLTHTDHTHVHNMTHTCTHTPDTPHTHTSQRCTCTHTHHTHLTHTTHTHTHHTPTGLPHHVAAVDSLVVPADSPGVPPSANAHHLFRGFSFVASSLAQEPSQQDLHKATVHPVVQVIGPPSCRGSRRARLHSPPAGRGEEVAALRGPVSRLRRVGVHFLNEPLPLPPRGHRDGDLSHASRSSSRQKES